MVLEVLGESKYFQINKNIIITIKQYKSLRSQKQGKNK